MAKCPKGKGGKCKCPKSKGEMVVSFNAEGRKVSFKACKKGGKSASTKSSTPAKKRPGRPKGSKNNLTSLNPKNEIGFLACVCKLCAIIIVI